MMDGVRGWLLSILSAGVLCAVAEALMPQGPVKVVGRLVCGLVLLCAILAPVTDLNLENGNHWLEDYFLQLDEEKGALEEVVGQEMKSIIEEEYAAYIVDKAAELGLTCTARVTCREGEAGVYLPDSAVVCGLGGAEEVERLAQIVAEDLGIPQERQSYLNEEVSS